MAYFIYNYAECRYAECPYAECHYVECRYVECRGAYFIDGQSSFRDFLFQFVLNPSKIVALTNRLKLNQRFFELLPPFIWHQIGSPSLQNGSKLDRQTTLSKLFSVN